MPQNLDAMQKILQEFYYLIMLVNTVLFNKLYKPSPIDEWKKIVFGEKNYLKFMFICACIEMSICKDHHLGLLAMIREENWIVMYKSTALWIAMWVLRISNHEELVLVIHTIIIKHGRLSVCYQIKGQTLWNFLELPRTL